MWDGNRFLWSCSTCSRTIWQIFCSWRFTFTIAQAFKQITREIKVDELIRICPGQVNPDISSQAPFCDKKWTRDIYPKAFTGQKICAMAANQGWTFKPVKMKDK